MKRRDFLGSGAVALSAAGALALPAAARTGAPGMPRFASLAEMAESRPRTGDLCSAAGRCYEIRAAGTYPANARTVVDLGAGAGQAVLAAEEPLADMAELLADTRGPGWFREGGLLRARAEGLSFEIAQAGDADPSVATEGGARLRPIDRPLVEFAAFGGGPERGGEQNAQALLRAMRGLGASGGRILFGAGVHRFAPQVYPVTDATVWLIGAGYRATQFTPSVEGDGDRRWMMQFGADDAVSYLGFSGIDLVAPETGKRARFNGIRVCSTNQMIIRDCYGRFVDGTAWQLERAHNSKIDIRTYASGAPGDGLHSLLLTGTLGNFAVDQDAVFNDVVLAGMTEQDLLGWKIENGLVIRPESSIKVHGGPQSTRSLHLHRINNGAMSVYPTLGFDADAFIVISDGDPASPASGPDAAARRGAPVEAQSVEVTNASKPTRFNLNIISNNNIRYFGKGTGALVAIDCGVPNSRVILTGDLLRNVPVEGGGEYRYVRLVGPGNPRAEIDLSGLRFQDEDAGKWVEDNRTRASALLSRRATGVYLPAVAGFSRAAPASRLVGQTEHILAGGGPKEDGVPRMTLLGLTEASAPGGTLLYSAMQPLSATLPAAPGAVTLIASQRLNLPAHGALGATALLRRLTFGASGIPERSGESDYWRIRLYAGAKATDLVPSRDRASEVEGDGLPSKVLEGWSAESQGFDFHQGIDSFAVDRTQTFSLRLEPVGRPAGLTDITVVAYFEARH